MSMSGLPSAEHYDLEVVRVPNFKAIIVHSVESMDDRTIEISNGPDSVVNRCAWPQVMC
jgi:hypothetical protein